MNGHPAAGISLVASTVPWVAQCPGWVSTSVAMMAPFLHRQVGPAQRLSGTQLNRHSAMARPAMPHSATMSRSPQAKPAPVVCGL